MLYSIREGVYRIRALGRERGRNALCRRASEITAIVRLLLLVDIAIAKLLWRRVGYVRPRLNQTSLWQLLPTRRAEDRRSHGPSRSKCWI
jgi:hypothetical protein